MIQKDRHTHRQNAAGSIQNKDLALLGNCTSVPIHTCIKQTLLVRNKQIFMENGNCYGNLKIAVDVDLINIRWHMYIYFFDPVQLLHIKFLTPMINLDSIKAVKNQQKPCSCSG